MLLPIGQWSVQEFITGAQELGCVIFPITSHSGHHPSNTTLKICARSWSERIKDEDNNLFTKTHTETLEIDELSQRTISDCDIHTTHRPTLNNLQVDGDLIIGGITKQEIEIASHIGNYPHSSLSTKCIDGLALRRGNKQTQGKQHIKLITSKQPFNKICATDIRPDQNPSHSCDESKSIHINNEIYRLAKYINPNWGAAMYQDTQQTNYVTLMPTQGYQLNICLNSITASEGIRRSDMIPIVMIDGILALQGKINPITLHIDTKGTFREKIITTFLQCVPEGKLSIEEKNQYKIRMKRILTQCRYNAITKLMSLIQANTTHINQEYWSYCLEGIEYPCARCDQPSVINQEVMNSTIYLYVSQIIDRITATWYQQSTLPPSTSTIISTPSQVNTIQPTTATRTSCDKRSYTPQENYTTNTISFIGTTIALLAMIGCYVSIIFNLRKIKSTYRHADLAVSRIRNILTSRRLTQQT